MGITEWVAVLVIFAVVYCLIKRYETRLVLIGSGLLLCLISWNLVGGLNAFAKSMTNASLVMAICGSMGFAFVAKYTEADRSLVHYLSAPIRGLGIFLVPVCTAITFFVNIAIPSAAGCAAAVGSTLIPVMLRAGIKPAGAAAAVLAGTIGSYLSPGTSHNPYVANMAHIDVMEFIGFHAPYSIMIGAFGVISRMAAPAFIVLPPSASSIVCIASHRRLGASCQADRLTESLHTWLSARPKASGKFLRRRLRRSLRQDCLSPALRAERPPCPLYPQ